MAKRLAGRCGYPEGDGFEPTIHSGRLEEPLKIKKSKRIFVCSMGDLFHEKLAYNWITDVWRIMSRANWHTFYILTKRPKLMKNFIDHYFKFQIAANIPLENISHIWLGVSVENQQTADERIPILLSIPAAKKFVSCEPLLGPINFGWGDENTIKECREKGQQACSWCPDRECTDNTTTFLDWVVAGGETGPGARPCHPDWARGIRDQCQAARVPFFFKGFGTWQPIDQPWEQDSPKPLAPNEDWLNLRGGCGFHGEEVWRMRKTGKKAAGNLLDGKEWSEQP